MMDLFVRLFLVTFIGLVARAERAVFMGRELFGRELLGVQHSACERKGTRRVAARRATLRQTGKVKGQ